MTAVSVCWGTRLRVGEYLLAERVTGVVGRAREAGVYAVGERVSPLPSAMSEALRGRGIREGARPLSEGRLPEVGELGVRECPAPL
jgi:hypothetical protein